MLILLLIFLLVSNAVILRQDKSILFSRVVIQSLIFASFIAFNNLYHKPLEMGIGIYGGLFNVSTLSHTFNIFIFIVSSVILIFTAFYPRKVYNQQCFSLYNISKLLYNKNVMFIQPILLTFISIFAVLSIRIPLNIMRNVSIPGLDNGSITIIFLGLTGLTGIVCLVIGNIIRHSKFPTFIQFLIVLTPSIFALILFIYIPTEWFNIVSISKTILDIICCEITLAVPIGLNGSSISHAMNPSNNNPPGSSSNNLAGSSNNNSAVPSSSHNTIEYDQAFFNHTRNKLRSLHDDFTNKLRTLKWSITRYENSSWSDEEKQMFVDSYIRPEFNSLEDALAKRRAAAIQASIFFANKRANDFLPGKSSFEEISKYNVNQSIFIDKVKEILDK
jgi:hypothetical protein